MLTPSSGSPSKFSPVGVCKNLDCLYHDSASSMVTSSPGGDWPTGVSNSCTLLLALLRRSVPIPPSPPRSGTLRGGDMGGVGMCEFGLESRVDGGRELAWRGASKRAALASAPSGRGALSFFFSSRSMFHIDASHRCFSSGCIDRTGSTSAPPISRVGQGKLTAISRRVNELSPRKTIRSCGSTFATGGKAQSGLCSRRSAICAMAPTSHSTATSSGTEFALSSNQPSISGEPDWLRMGMDRLSCSRFWSFMIKSLYWLMASSGRPMNLPMLRACTISSPRAIPDFMPLFRPLPGQKCTVMAASPATATRACGRLIDFVSSGGRYCTPSRTACTTMGMRTTLMTSLSLKPNSLRPSLIDFHRGDSLSSDGAKTWPSVKPSGMEPSAALRHPG
ncbi:hypothetical protein ACKVWC_011582 [Pyricularia oryzae]